MIFSRVPASAAICGSISIGMAAASSTLPAWFETMMPSAVVSAAVTVAHLQSNYLKGGIRLGI